MLTKKLNKFYKSKKKKAHRTSIYFLEQTTVMMLSKNSNTSAKVRNVMPMQRPKVAPMLATRSVLVILEICMIFKAREIRHLKLENLLKLHSISDLLNIEPKRLTFLEAFTFKRVK